MTTAKSSPPTMAAGWTTTRPIRERRFGLKKWRMNIIGKIWIQANMNENGIIDLLVAPGVAAKIKGVDVYEIGAMDVKCEFEKEENDDSHMDT